MAKQFDFKALDAPIEADWPVEVSVPLDGGKAEIQRFSARFRIVSKEQHDAIQENLLGVISSVTGGEDPKSKPDPYAMYRAFWIGFGKPTSDEQTFDEQTFEKMVGVPYVRDALMAAYNKFSKGVAVKN